MKPIESDVTPHSVSTHQLGRGRWASIGCLNLEAKVLSIGPGKRWIGEGLERLLEDEGSVCEDIAKCLDKLPELLLGEFLLGASSSNGNQ